jgi:3'-5' exoribonuclease
MEQTAVSQFVKDMRFDGFLLVRSAEQRTATSGSRYLDMNLADKTGEINAKVWDSAATAPQTGMALKVRGLVLEYNGRLQLRVDKMRPVEPQDEMDVSLLTPCAPEPPEEMRLTLQKVIDNMTREPLKVLLAEALRMAGEELNYFPAAQRLHHAERSGLLHHTTSMLKTADAVLACYPFLDADLLRAGVILHDLAKIEEMDSDSFGNVSDYTEDGLLVGHLVRGVAQLREAAAKVQIDGELVLLLEHMIISHHGEPEYGSPRRPMFPEAEALHWIDVLDARMNEMQGIMDRIPEGSFSEKIWSLDRRMYHPRYGSLNIKKAEEEP